MKRLLAIFVAVSAMALVSACTSKPDDHGIASVAGSAAPTASPSRDSPDAFIACMHDHGQEVPAPQQGVEWHPDPPGAVTEAWRTAVDACRGLLPGSQGQKTISPQELEKLRSFAVCMRAHDIEMTDPETSGDRPGNMLIKGRFENVTRAQLEADPVFKAAMDACKDKLPVEPKKDGR